VRGGGEVGRGNLHLHYWHYPAQREAGEPRDARSNPPLRPGLAEAFVSLFFPAFFSSATVNDEYSPAAKSARAGEKGGRIYGSAKAKEEEEVEEQEETSSRFMPRGQIASKGKR